MIQILKQIWQLKNTPYQLHWFFYRPLFVILRCIMLPKKIWNGGFFGKFFFFVTFHGKFFFFVDVISLEKLNKCISDTNLFLNYCLKYDVSLNISISHRDINVLSQHFNVTIKRWANSIFLKVQAHLSR